MRYVSLIRDEEIVIQRETTMTDDQCQELDQMLRDAGILSDNEELAITEDL